MDTTTPTQDPPTTSTTQLGQPLIAYGETCTWWNSVDAAGVANGHPACPCCDGPVRLVDEEAWETMVQQAADQNADLLVDVGDGSYQAFVAWLRGRCWSSIAKAAEAYRTSGAATGHGDLDELHQHALPADAPGAWIRDAIEARQADEPGLVPSNTTAEPDPPAATPTGVDDPLRAGQTYLQRYLGVLAAAGPDAAPEHRVISEVHTVIDMVARIVDCQDPPYRIEKSAPLVDAALAIELEAHRRLARHTDRGALLDEALGQVEHLHRHVRNAMLAIAAGSPVPRSAIADLDAFTTTLTRWVRSIEALDQTGGPS